MQKLLLLLLIVLAGCSGARKAAELNPPPAWVQSKPILENDYTGVGSAQKIGPRETYINKAKEDALANLAEDISVLVSTTSVLHTLESKYGNAQTFDQTIKISAVDQLEGHEPVDFWEDELNYCTYYKIDKNTYAKNKAARKQEALNQSVNNYVAGQNELRKNHAPLAISFFLKGLETLKPYLSESCETLINNEQKDIGIMLLTSLYETVNNLEAAAIVSSETLMKGNPKNKSFKFRVSYKGVPQRGVPLILTVSDGYLSNEKITSNQNGIATLSNERFSGMKGVEVLSANIDLQTIGRQAINDLFIRSLLKTNKLQPASMQINVLNPSIELNISGINCSNTDCNSINKVFKEVALNQGFDVSDDLVNFSILLHLTIENKVFRGNLNKASIEGNLQILNTNSEVIWAKTFYLPEAGLGQTETMANKNAMVEFNKNFELIYLKQAFDAIR